MAFELRVGIPEELERKIAKLESILDDSMNKSKKVVLAHTREVISFVKVFGHETQTNEVGYKRLVFSYYSICLLFLSG